MFEQYGHQLSVSPHQVLKAMSVLLMDETVVSNFGRVETSLIQSEEGLDEILALRQLRRLRITYALPNPDDLGSFEAAMQQRLRDQHIQRQTLELEADTTNHIIPDEQTNLLAQSALSNGAVEGTGYDASNNFGNTEEYWTRCSDTDATTPLENQSKTPLPRCPGWVETSSPCLSILRFLLGSVSQFG